MLKEYLKTVFWVIEIQFANKQGSFEVGDF